MSLRGAPSSPICLCSHPVLTNNRDSPDCLMKSTCVGVAALPQNVYLLVDSCCDVFLCQGNSSSFTFSAEDKISLEITSYKIQGSWQLAHCISWVSGAPPHGIFPPLRHKHQTKPLCGGSGIIRWLSSMSWTPDKTSPKGK